MIIERGALAGVLLITPRRHEDARGAFVETYKSSALDAADLIWRQDNHAINLRKGTVRGLHFQAPPAAQAKLIRVVSGAVLDVCVDLRRGSPTFGRAMSVELDAKTWRQLLIPAGFAHGYCTLTNDAAVLYKASAEYAPELECGLFWRDPVLSIDWPVSEGDAVMSERDRDWPPLASLHSPFTYAPS